ncbi:MAG: PEP-CTERM sorting domain-containing protein [Pseudomonadales bacterium]|nr:PEP-CTERM sorting domain-containing protein [Pseudomonadales bacterium]
MASAKDLTYAETLTTTGIGGDFEAFHIASQSEAYTFYNSLGVASPAVDVIGQQNISSLISPVEDGVFGHSAGPNADLAWFLSDEAPEFADHIRLFDLNTTSSQVAIDDHSRTIINTDAYSIGGSSAFLATGWLLVGDASTPSPSTTSTGVPAPAPLALMALGLLGLGASRRKSASVKRT